MHKDRRGEGSRGRGDLPGARKHRGDLSAYGQRQQRIQQRQLSGITSNVVNTSVPAWRPPGAIFLRYEHYFWFNVYTILNMFYLYINTF